jgi:molybdopterin-guanine dinucleotide biosynthesis protein A
MQDIETVILAGGKSSRMGEDKALLPFQGKPFLSYICEQTIPVSQKVYIVTPWAEKYRDLVPNDCQFISEINPFQGPLSAFAQTFEYIDSDWILLLACDLPYIKRDVFEFWIQQLSVIDRDAVAFLAPNEKGWECLAGFYRSTCIDSLRKYLQTGKKSFQDWLKQEKVIPLPVENSDIFFNCNTLQEYRKIKQQ